MKRSLLMIYLKRIFLSCRLYIKIIKITKIIHSYLLGHFNFVGKSYTARICLKACQESAYHFISLHATFVEKQITENKY